MLLSCTATIVGELLLIDIWELIVAIHMARKARKEKMTINKKVFDKLKGRRIYQFYLDEKTGEITDITDSMDYVKVIRCKDCDWYGIVELKQDGTVDMRHKPSWCFLWRSAMNVDDYCSYAVREEE